MALVYLDMIKLAVPTHVRGCALEAEAQYLMFGTYDMLYYALPDSNSYRGIKWLGDRHENRHDLDWNYERHPVHVYCLEGFVDRLTKVLDKSSYSARPLVPTMVRVAKWPLSSQGIALDVALSSLQKQIDAKVAADDSDAPIVACWNLGNADFLILSRPSCLSKVRDLYLALNAEGMCIDEGGKRVLTTKFTSFSSYCAFPKGRGADRRMNKNGIRAWLFSDPDLEFVGFVDSLSDPGAIASRLHPDFLLLGERDYQVLVNTGGDVAERVDSVVSIVEEMLDPSTDSVIHSSSLIPSLPVPNQGTSAPPPVLKTYDVSWKPIDSVRTKVVSPLKSMCALIKGKEDIFQGLTSGYLEQIDHCINTLDALYKYATRLYAAAYQDDVYYVIANLYDGMGQILKDSLTKMKELCSNECAGELRVMVPRTYVEVMRFVSELQHVYTVLAISPHSHMETYYGSMRSLNATSKLWTSYSGVAKILCELFPSRDGSPVETWNVLMVPYREKYAQSSRIFPGPLSTSKLVLIELNYKTMFDLRSTSIIIAHELGHHIFNVTREVRSKLLVKSLVSIMLTKALSDMLTYPLYTLTHAPKTRGHEEGKIEIEKYACDLLEAKICGTDVKKWQRVLCLNILDTLYAAKYNVLYEEMTQDLQNEYLSIIVRIVNESANDFKKHYDIAIDEKPELGQYYGNDVMAQIIIFLDEKMHEYYCDAYRGISEKNTKFLRGIGTYEERHSLRIDPQQVVKFGAYWLYSQKDKLKRDINAVHMQYHKSVGTLLELFREIHAEIFACKATGLELEDYLDHVASCADVDPNLLMNPSNLRRIMVVCEAALDDRECRKLVDWAKSVACPFDKSVRDAAVSEIELIGSQPYYVHMREYGDEVAKSVMDRICIFDARQKTELESIRAFAKRDEQSLRYMWDFWLRTMRYTKPPSNSPSAC